MNSPQLHMTAPDKAEQLAKVRRACEYITDDKAISDYLGVAIEIVREERLKGIRKGRVQGHVLSAPPIAGNETAVREASTRSCQAHLKALVQYGLKHGLPNMTAEMVLEKAKELGVSA